jgi:hypothetical protein
MSRAERDAGGRADWMGSDISKVQVRSSCQAGTADCSVAEAFAVPL